MTGTAARLLRSRVVVDGDVGEATKARRLFGWNPTSPNLLDGLTSGSYVQASV